MHVITVAPLREFWGKHADAEQALKAWYHEAKRASWNSFIDIKECHRSADCIPGDRVVFNIKGNNYRLIVKIHYNTGVVFIRFVGTHKEYDGVNAETV